jgi:hypothetical protein
VERTERDPQGESIYRSWMGGSAQSESPRSVQTALDRSSHLGWAEIRHPFHPLRGQRFDVLKQRRIAGVDTLIVREPEFGSISIAREWTDWADPSVYDGLSCPPRRFDAESLFQLVTLVELLMERGGGKC